MPPIGDYTQYNPVYYTQYYPQPAHYSQHPLDRPRRSRSVYGRSVYDSDDSASVRKYKTESTPDIRHRPGHVNQQKLCVVCKTKPSYSKNGKEYLTCGLTCASKLADMGKLATPSLCVVCHKRPQYSTGGKRFPTCGSTCANRLSKGGGSNPVHHQRAYFSEGEKEKATGPTDVSEMKSGRSSRLTKRLISPVSLLGDRRTPRHTAYDSAAATERGSGREIMKATHGLTDGTRLNSGRSSGLTMQSNAPMSFSGDRRTLRRIADETVAVIEKDSYIFQGKTFPLHTKQSKQETRYYAPDSFLAKWSSARSPPKSSPSFITNTSIYEISALDGARLLASELGNNPGHNGKIAILNFASATKPGGGFLNGAQAQEESIARSSTLYPTLLENSAQKFYDLHIRHPENHYYTHSLIYSPNVKVFRDDYGGWTLPITVDVLTCAAVNAGKVRAFTHGGSRAAEARIEAEMKERMGRILYLLEKKGAKNIVLGSFGTGVFRNDIEVVARLWAELLMTRFRSSFDRVIFAISAHHTFVTFENAFQRETSLLEKSSKRNVGIVPPPVTNPPFIRRLVSPIPTAFRRA